MTTPARVRPGPIRARPGEADARSRRPGDRPSAFAHASEAELARILDFYAVHWEYEPQTFPIGWNLDGDVVESFSPDFYLPDLDLYVELTTLKQKLVRKKNRKLRRLRELYPNVRIKLFYARDFRMLLLKFGRLALATELSGTSGQARPTRLGGLGPIDRHLAGHAGGGDGPPTHPAGSAVDDPVGVAAPPPGRAAGAPGRVAAPDPGRVTEAPGLAAQGRIPPVAGRRRARRRRRPGPAVPTGRPSDAARTTAPPTT